MHIKDLRVSPPGDWKFTQKESSYTMRTATYNSLLGKIQTHRTNMNYPRVSEGYRTLSEEVQDIICKSMSQEDQVAYCDMGVSTATSVPWKMVAQFFKTMGEWFTSNGFQTVPQEEAERRAAICAGCPMNVGLSGCGVCQTALQGIRVALMQASTSHDKDLEACGVCGCDLKMSVHVPLDALKAGQTSDLKYPAWCWKSTATE